MKKNHLTIIFMKDTRKPVTFEVSIKLVILIVVLLLGSASTYAFFIRGYYSLYRDNEKLELIIRSLKTDIGRLQSTITRIKSAEPDSTSLAATGADEQSTDETVQSGEESISVDNFNLNLNAQENKVDYYFILHKSSEDNEILRGYLFVALLNSQSGEKIASFPEADYRDSLPVNYHQGDRYAIRRFKEYKGEFALAGTADLIEVVVYSEMGDVQLKFRRRLRY